MLDKLRKLKPLLDGVYLVPYVEWRTVFEEKKPTGGLLIKCENCSGWQEMVDAGTGIEDLLGQVFLHCDRAHEWFEREAPKEADPCCFVCAVNGPDAELCQDCC